MPDIIGYYVFTTVNGGQWLTASGERTSRFHDAEEFTTHEDAQLFADQHIVDAKEVPYIFALTS